MLKEVIAKVAAGEDIPFETAKEVMDKMMQGEVNEIQMSALLTAMHIKGESVDEITAFALGMRKHCVQFPRSGDLLEIVGTGGDKCNTFNISTISALVTSAAGVPVAKHGNRAATSKCGAADCLEALGVNITISPEQSAEILDKINLAFLFAISYHTALKYIMPVRRNVGIPTIFNILGPLANPANANMQLLGVYDISLLEPLAKVLYKLGVKSAMVVHGRDGVDEISSAAETDICQVKNGEFTTFTISPEQFGMTRCKPEDLVGGTPEENAQIVRDILAGQKGPKRDAVLLNTAAALVITHPEYDFEKGLEIAAETIDSGKAARQLESLITLSNGGTL